MTWIYDKKPDSRRPVLALIESDVVGSLKKRRQIVRAEWIPARAEEASPWEPWDDDEGAYECVEEEGAYYIKEGWYELMNYWEDYGYIAISDPVIAWMPMPELP